MASICCSPPESFVPWLVRAPGGSGTAVDLLDAHAALRDQRRQEQVLVDA